MKGDRMKKMYKIWKTGMDIYYFIEKENMDEAFAEARKMCPDADSGQLCTEEEAERIRKGERA